MELIKLIQALDISVGELSLYVVIILTLVQIVPIKINPWSWIAKHIGKAINGEVLDKVDGLETKIDDLEKRMQEVDLKNDRRDAINHRVRILRFGDEILEGRKHSKDSYDQVLTDITDYNAYCDKHPEFKNDQTVATVEHIRKCYAVRLEKHDFL